MTPLVSPKFWRPVFIIVLNNTLNIKNKFKNLNSVFRILIIL